MARILLDLPRNGFDNRLTWPGFLVTVEKQPLCPCLATTSIKPKFLCHYGGMFQNTTKRERNRVADGNGWPSIWSPPSISSLSPHLHHLRVATCYRQVCRYVARGGNCRSWLLSGRWCLARLSWVDQRCALDYHCHICQLKGRQGHWPRQVRFHEDTTRKAVWQYDLGARRYKRWNFLP